MASTKCLVSALKCQHDFFPCFLKIRVPVNESCSPDNCTNRSCQYLLSGFLQMFYLQKPWYKKILKSNNFKLYICIILAGGVSRVCGWVRVPRVLPDGDPHTHAPRQEDAQGTPWLLIHTKALGTRQFKNFATTTTQQRKKASETAKNTTNVKSSESKWGSRKASRPMTITDNCENLVTWLR